MSVTKTPMTEQMLAAEQERQNESDAAMGVEQFDDGGSNDGGDSGSDESARREPDESSKPIQMSPNDVKRMEFAARFKQQDVDKPFDGDMTNPENLYGDFGAEALESDPDEPEPGVPEGTKSIEDRGDQAQQRTFKLKIRGKEVTLTEAEVLERASKVEAADSYLQESRDLLEGAKEILADRRAGQNRQHPDGETGAQDDGSDSDRSEASRRPGNDLDDTINKIQFGSTEEAAAALAKYVQTAAAEQANKGHLDRLMSNDLARAKKALGDFVAANPDLNADENASALIEKSIYGIYRKELEAIGLEPDQIPKDPAVVAHWHRYYRVNGANVSQVQDVLNKAKDAYTTWRGQGTQTNKPAAKPRGNDRVSVNVDRTERRVAIPNQPARTAAVRRDAPQADRPKSNSDIIAEMRRARGQPTG